jgi:hypothetical protein
MVVAAMPSLVRYAEDSPQSRTPVSIARVASIPRLRRSRTPVSIAYASASIEQHHRQDEHDDDRPDHDSVG